VILERVGEVWGTASLEALVDFGNAVPGPDFSALAPVISRAAEDGDEVARQVLLQAAADLAAAQPAAFDLVCCMELAEHVPDPAELVAALAQLLRPGGALFISTINRTPQAYFGAIVAAEYLLRLVPRGTHEYARLIRPAELARAARPAGLELRGISGLAYNPLTRRATLSARPDVNYIAHFTRSTPA